jgi:hypothetical protein
VALALAASASPSHAQRAQPKRFSPGIGGGFSRGPGGGIGYHALATLDVRTPLPWARVRVDGMFTDWGGGSLDSGPFTSLSLNAIAAPFPNASVAPYLLAGGGGYLRATSSVRPGFTVGAGLRLSGARSLLIETRLHHYRRLDSERRSVAENLGVTLNKWAPLWTPLGVTVQF